MDEPNDINFENEENKNKKVIIGIIIFVILVLGALWGGNKIKNSNNLSYNSELPEQTEETTTPPQTPITMCFNSDVKTKTGLINTTMLKLTVTGDILDGELSHYPAAKDSKIGMFKGTATLPDPTTGERTASVWWDAISEGTQVTEELSFSFTDVSATIHYGTMNDRGDGTYVYKDKTALTSGTPLLQIQCDTLSEKKNTLWITK